MQVLTKAIVRQRNSVKPDRDDYVGYDPHHLRHPQALIVTEMMDAPLTQCHGPHFRPYTLTKYGYKQIKRISLIAYTNEKPDDFWTTRGCDWYGACDVEGLSFPANPRELDGTFRPPAPSSVAQRPCP